MKLHLTLDVLIISLLVILGSCNSSKDDTRGSAEFNYAIIYNVLVDIETENYEIFAMNLDGSDKKNISNLPGVEWTYFSDKDRVLFISDKDTCRRCFFLFETNYKGENPKQVSKVRLADSWMSSRNNGSELIVRPHQSIDSVFYIIDLKGNILNRIETGLPYCSDPLFVNDGKQIVFRGGLTKSKLFKGFNEELYIMSSDGENIKQLTHFPQSDTSAGQFAFRAGTPKLHPTKNFVSYQSKQNGKYSLYAISLDGKEHWKLTDNLQNEGWHDWSPDGKWLAIELFDDEQSQFHIGLMDWESKEMKILTDTSYRYQQSPNFVIKN